MIKYSLNFNKLNILNKIKYIFFILIFDFLISNLIFKNTPYWNVVNWEEKYWRIPSNIYHHDILPNIDKVEKWGGKINKRIVTNSIGFVDKKNRTVPKINVNKKRILLVGDSFIEGSGLNYEFTVAGLLDEYLGNNYEILNSAVGSYSPSIYFKKTKFYLDKGYKFNQALVFLDISDIYDELFIKFDDNENILTYEERKNRSFAKKKFYALGRFLRDNTITFRFLNIISDKLEIAKNYLKLKSKTSKELNRSFFNTNQKDVMFYRMTHIDRGFWTFDEKKFGEIEEGLEQSKKYLLKLFDLLKKNNISSTLIIYPWPTQILYGDNYHQIIWKEFAEKYEVDFINMYEYFNSENKEKFIFENFIYGDIHWNKKGTKIIFDNLIKNIKF